MIGVIAVISNELHQRISVIIGFASNKTKHTYYPGSEVPELKKPSARAKRAKWDLWQNEIKNSF